MGLSPLAFTGVSKFSADFQQIVRRAITIASVPLQQVQNQQADLLRRKSLVGDLEIAVDGVGRRVAALAALGESKALGASSSNPAKVLATVTGATQGASYTISEITSLARAAAETSTSGFANGATVSPTGAFRLVVGSQTYNFTLAAGENSLAGLRDAINGLGAGVTASVLTTGTGATPNYLSVSANTAGARTLQLVEDPDGAATQFLTSTNQGANTEFKLNGVSVSRTNSVVNDVVPGLTFSITGTTSPGETVSIALRSDRSQLAGSLRALASAYNTVVDKVDGQIGESAGLLTGDRIVRDIQGALRALTNYSAPGAISSLADLGIELARDGKMSFNQTTFDLLADDQIQEAFQFLGSPTAGIGGVAARFTQLSDPVVGAMKLQRDQFDEVDRRLKERTDGLTQRLTELQANLTLRLQTADALLAQLESQQAGVDASIQGLSLVMFGRSEK